MRNRKKAGVDRVYQGSALRRARMLARKSIKAAAEALDVSEGAISQWELGMSSPSIRALEQLASFYDMPMDTMLDPESVVRQDDLKSMDLLPGQVVVGTVAFEPPLRMPAMALIFTGSEYDEPPIMFALS